MVNTRFIFLIVKIHRGIWISTLSFWSTQSSEFCCHLKFVEEMAFWVYTRFWMLILLSHKIHRISFLIILYFLCDQILNFASTQDSLSCFIKENNFWWHKIPKSLSTWGSLKQSTTFNTLGVNLCWYCEYCNIFF